MNSNLLNIKPDNNNVLVINSDSTCVKFVLYRTGEQSGQIFHSSLNRIGLLDTILTFKKSTGSLNCRLILSLVIIKFPPISSSVNFFSLPIPKTIFITSASLSIRVENIYSISIVSDSFARFSSGKG